MTRSPHVLTGLLAALPAMAQPGSPPAPPASAASAAHAGGAPVAGRWEFSVVTQGGPGGANTQTGSACLTAEPLDASPELTLYTAAMRSTGGKGADCKFNDLRRDTAPRSWKTECQGPMGVTLTGDGHGEFSPDAATLSQTLEGRMFLKKIVIVKTVSARRAGAC